MITLIDNYDSFTYNLVQYLGQCKAEITVIRNDAASVDDILNSAPNGIVISPGPGHPRDAGLSLSLLQRIIADEIEIPVLGVCLGHQCIAQACSVEISHAPTPVHGKTSRISHNSDSVFKGLPSPLEVTRYHSLLAARDHVNDQLVITAKTEDDDLIMGMCHSTLPIHGVQFHPESIATQNGMDMIQNFIEITK